LPRYLFLFTTFLQEFNRLGNFDSLRSLTSKGKLHCILIHRGILALEEAVYNKRAYYKLLFIRFYLSYEEIYKGFYPH